MRRDISRAGRAPSSAPGARGNALWGGGRTGKRTTIVLATMVALIALGAGQVSTAGASSKNAYVPKQLLADAAANPSKMFDVIVQGVKDKSSGDVAREVEDTRKQAPAKDSALKRKFLSVNGVSATLSGAQLVKLADKSWIAAITPDTKVELTAYQNNQIWPQSAALTDNWASTAVPASSYPTIAVVDSGITGSLPTFGGRVAASVNLVSWTGTSGAYGHGSLVGSVAAGGETGYTGSEPRAKLVSLKVLDGAGVGVKSDVIAACDWILQNKAAYNIRVANFSLNTAGESFRFDALDRAVESLWLNGVVVVVASGNYAVDGARSDVGFAPANDPFVITVGASDVAGTAKSSDDFAAPWSAWGYTQDGFFKPEVAAPGRVMNGALPSSAALKTQFPSRVIDSTHMWMSGTSFAAPVVSGMAAALLAKNPSWTPDQVKGAIMQTVSVPSGYNSAGGLGVGVVNLKRALTASGDANPNAGLNQFVETVNGQKVFDAANWYAEASTNASWNSASWSSASWSSASWSSASWSSASWSSASWSSASWSSASWSSASWANAAGVE
jgi:serine protease AprX